ncbi:MAG: SDR family oxidoreductase, partial [Octadecabacter sp.]|nr:SDR family oxidoreductase [Octadecabacter sp.]
MGRVSGRSCIVTGAAQGIGRAIAEALLEEGASVCFADINGEKVSEVAHQNKKAYGDNNVTAAQVDVTNRADVQAMIGHTVAKFGKLNVNFNNAGVNKPMNFLDVTEENWRFINDVNGLGCLIG